MNINDPSTALGLAIPFTKRKTAAEQRLPLARLLPDAFRNHFIAMCGEFVGTVLFLFFALSGTQVAQNVKSSSGLTVAETGDTPQQLQYIALCFGFSLAVNAWVFFRISGGLFNPAVTFGMCLIGALPWVRGVLLFFVQILGGMVAAALVSCMFPGALNVTTSLNGGTTVVQGLFIEMFLTAELIFTIFMLAAEKHKGTFIAPVGIGLALFIAELTGVYFTGGSLNPARTFGPAVATLTFDTYHWIYWVGPLLGAIVAAGFYKFIKILEYETANPGQDMDHDLEVQQRAELLVAAGINAIDAHQVANELTVEAKATNGQQQNEKPAMANGKGRGPTADDPRGMYGTQFRNSSETTLNGTPRRPAAVTTSSQTGRYSYLGKAGRQSSVAGAATKPRTDSPGMASHDEIYAPLQAGGDEPLGGMINGQPRMRVNRTPSTVV